LDTNNQNARTGSFFCRSVWRKGRRRPPRDQEYRRRKHTIEWQPSAVSDFLSIHRCQLRFRPACDTIMSWRLSVCLSVCLSVLGTCPRNAVCNILVYIAQRNVQRAIWVPKNPAYYPNPTYPNPVWTFGRKFPPLFLRSTFFYPLDLSRPLIFNWLARLVWGQALKPTFAFRRPR